MSLRQSGDEEHRRNKEQTRRRLIEAVISILKEEGFDALGVNAIAQKAGVSKVLIYRYFGGLPGLYRAVADVLDMNKIDFIDTTRLFNSEKNPREAVREAFLETHRRLAGDELAIQLMIRELSESNELTRSLAEARETAGVELSRQISESLPVGAARERDIPAALAVLSAGLYYLTLRSRTVRMYNGIDIRSEEGWRRICDAMAGFFSD